MDEGDRLTAKWTLGKYHGSVEVPEMVTIVSTGGVSCVYAEGSSLYRVLQDRPGHIRGRL